jgi:uncharacterized protein (DUF2062 family)
MPIRRLVQKAKGFLRQGLQPRELAASIAIAVLIGVFPIYGTTTWIIVFLAWRLSLNLPLMLFVSYLLTPLQLLLIIPLMRVGEWLFGFPYVDLDLASLQAAFQNSVLDTFSTFSGRLLLSIAGWFLLVGPLTLGLFILLFQILRILHRRKMAERIAE